MILGVLAFWLFAQTTLNIAPTMAADLGIETSVMNIAVSIAALFSGIFVVVMGGLADRIGRVKTVQWGFILSIVGSILVALAPPGALASPLLILGRICQGLSGACIMPASLALVKAYWDGAGRQRAISLWSMGSWGGSGFAALFGGLMAANVGWRWIFFASVAVSVVGLLMVRGTPESRAEARGDYTFDTKGVVTFMIAMVGLASLRDAGGGARLDKSRVIGPAGAEPGVRRPVLPRRVWQRQRLRGLRALQECDLYWSNDLEPAAQRRRGHPHRVHDPGADRRRHERARGRAAHARVRHRHRGVHQGRREAVAALRPAQADALGML